MLHLKTGTMALAAFLLLTPLLLACGGEDPGTPAGLNAEQVRQLIRAEAPEAPEAQDAPTKAEIEKAVDSAVHAAVEAALAALPEPETGVPEAQMEAAVREVVASMPPAPEAGLTGAEVQELIDSAMAAATGRALEEARRAAQYTVATIPPKTSPAEYTKFFVNNAISRYETEGRDSTIAYYNDVDSIDGQWYAFIVDESGTVISHFNAHTLGENLNGPLGTDADGYNFAPEMLAAGEDGAWVSYVYNNPATENIGPDHLGAIQLKHAWVIRHDGLLFGSGWYISSDEFTKTFVRDAIAMYHTQGLAPTLAHYNSPDSSFREWYMLIADDQGTVIAHRDPAKLGLTLDTVLGTQGFESTEDGAWFSVDETNPTTGRTQGKHTWLVKHDDMTFASGWYHDEEN